MWYPILRLILLRQKVLLKIRLMTVIRGGNIFDMAILRRMLVFLWHHIILVHLQIPCCFMEVIWRSRHILKIRHKILSSISHFRKILRCLILVHTFCVPRIHELFVVIKTTHVHLMVLELFIFLIIVLLKAVILVIRHTILALRLASEKRSVLIICQTSSLL